jgi:hypothetical protein
MDSNKHIHWRKGIKNGLQYVIIPLLVACAFYIIQNQFEKYKLKHTSDPYVAVLVSNRSIDFDIPIDFNTGFNNLKNKQDYFNSKDGKKVYIKHFEDFLSETESSRKIRELISDKNCLLIIGNANSTLTNSNIDILLSAEYKMPLIMPIATDNNIMQKVNMAGHKAVLRMLPDNKKQAESIQRLISKLSDSRKVVIYGDDENSSYSINLSRDIANKIRLSGGTILAEELIGAPNSIFPSMGFLSNEKLIPDAIIYVGVSHHAFLLIDQLSSINSSIPLIMTDGCLVGSILQQASLKYESKSYILSPAIPKDDTILNGSYELIGQDTYKLCEIIFSKSESTRSSIYQCIEIEKGKGDLDFSGQAGMYKFNHDGDNGGREYQIYFIEGGGGKKFNL